MAVRTGPHQIDGVMVGPAAQEREEVRHPIGFAKAEHVAVELGDLLDVDAVESDVAELERHDALPLEFLVREAVALEHLHHRALGIVNTSMSEIDGSGSLLRSVWMPWSGT